MRTVLLILGWIMMSIKLIFGLSNIEDLQSYITVYVMLSAFLGVMAWQYKKGDQIL